MAEGLDGGVRLDDWYRPEIDRRVLRTLAARSNLRSAVHVVAYFGLLVGLAAAIVELWWSWWAALLLVVYGNVWSLGSIALEHESLHGTFFRSRWANAVCAHVGGFMCGLEAIRYRWTHYRHHSNTLSTADPLDVESQSIKPIDRLAFVLNLIPLGGLLLPRRAFWYWHREVLRHATGRLTVAVRIGVPDEYHRSIVRAARIHVALWVAIVVWSALAGSLLPVLLLLVPSWYGSTLFLLCGLSQHAGLPIDVRDHRLNTRSFTTNPVLSFLYFGMQHHLEHHLFPQVPSRNLGRLQAELRDQLPEPRRGLLGCWREILPALWRRAKDPGYFIEVTLPIPDGVSTASIGQRGPQ